MKMQILVGLAFLASCLAFLRAFFDHRIYLRRLKGLEREVQEAKRNLERRGELAHEIAHEIKNPITAILCSAETLDLLLGPTLSEDHRKSLRYIKEYGDNLLRLLGDFLDISRAESGKLRSHPEPVNVLDLVQAVAGLLQSSTIAKKLSLTCSIVSENITALADPRQLKQIIFNLLHNAIKFTPEGGKIHILIRSDFPRPLVKIAIQDSGIGIPEDEVAHIFDPYEHSSLSQAKENLGVGLGLALTKALVELSGGQITVSSQVGVGSSFEVTLPEFIETDGKIVKSETLRRITEDRKPQVDKPLQGQSFLIIDANLAARESISDLLQAWGGMVDQVGKAREALEALSHKDYSAVMVDESEEGFKPNEISRMLKDKVDASRTAIVIASSSKLAEEQLQASGADLCIEKPLNGKTILKSLTSLERGSK